MSRILFPSLNLVCRHTVYIQEPRKQEWSWKQYIQILSLDVWISVLGAKLLFNVMLGFTYYISRHYKHRDSVKIHLTDFIFQIHAVFCHQGVVSLVLFYQLILQIEKTIIQHKVRKNYIVHITSYFRQETKVQRPVITAVEA